MRSGDWGFLGGVIYHLRRALWWGGTEGKEGAEEGQEGGKRKKKKQSGKGQSGCKSLRGREMTGR